MLRRFFYRIRHIRLVAGKKVLVLLLAFLVLFFAFSTSMKIAIAEKNEKLVMELSVSKIKAEISLIVSDYVKEGIKKLGSNSLMEVSRDSKGYITSVKPGSDIISIFKTELNSKLCSKLDRLKKSEISIPAGTLTGVKAFGASGPMINVAFRYITAVETKIITKIEDSTSRVVKYSAQVEVKCTSTIYYASNSKTVETVENATVAETLLVKNTLY